MNTDDRILAVLRPILDASARSTARITAETTTLVEEHLEATAGPLPHFDRLLQLSGLDNPSRAAATGQWEIWTAEERRPLGASAKLTVVVLLRAPTPERLNDIRTQLRRSLLNTTRTAVVLPPNAEITSEIRKRVILAFGEHAHIYTTTNLAADVRRRLLQRTAVELRDPFFVEPALIWDSDTAPWAAQTLISYFTDQTPGGRVAILLGPAGAGKSTLTEEVAATMQETTDAQSLTIRVSDKEWLALERRHQDVTPDSMLREALRKHGFPTDDLSQLDVLLANGALGLIFDSFDEVCTKGPISSPNKLLERILGLANIPHSQARILITSRPEFWETIDPDLRGQYEEVRLLPFDTERVESLLYLRFKDNPTYQKRARVALGLLGEDLQRIPLILRIICDAVAEGGEVGAWVSTTVSGIKHTDPLPGIARVLCERERDKHHWPQHADEQFALFARLAAEFGSTYTHDDIVQCAVIEAEMSEADAEKFHKHQFLKRVGDDEYAFHNTEMARTIIADWLAKQLNALAVPQPDRRLLVTVAKLLGRDGEYRNLSQRTGRLLADAHISTDVAAMLWNHRALLTPYQGAQSSLLRTLIEAFPPNRNGLRTLPFLPMEGGFLTATNFAYTGTLSKLDLSNIRFVNAHFQDVEISSCQCSQLTEFRDCNFVECTIGRDCDGLPPAAFARSEVDDNTVAQSKRWITFPGVRPEDIAKLALQRVIFRLLQTAGVLAERAPAAFSLGVNLTEDHIEEHALDVLTDLNIVDRTVLLIDKLYERDARKLLHHGEVTGRFQNAYKQMAGWTAKGLVH